LEALRHEQAPVTVQSLIPAFSLAERERRWSLVRRRMAEENLDCLIGFPNQGRFEQLQANTRYLVPIGGFATEVAVVFPLDAEVTAIVQSARDIGWWSRAQDWVGDLRPYRRQWSKGIVARLGELGLSKGARVGVIGLSGLMRAPEGVVPWTMFENVKASFPELEFVNATAVILETRAVKSAEEIAFIEKAEALAEMAVEAMFEIARAGVRENVLYATLIQTMIANGGELPTMIYWGAGQGATPEHLVPSTRELAPGDILSNEIEAKYGGYIAQIGAPAVVGPVPDAHRAQFDVTREIFDRLCPMIRPGIAVADIAQEYLAMVQEMGYRPAPWPLHGRGLGDDLPIMPSVTMESHAVFQAGHVLILKPGAIPTDGDDNAAGRAGDTVVVTGDGARRLGKRPLAITEIPTS
jgi:Xaa-Pro aminopeptidase